MPISTYSYVTLQQAVIDLYGRLYTPSSDATQQFWTPTELTAYIIEGLRVWNSLTSFWRAEIALTVSANLGVNGNAWWYDLTSQGPLRAYTVTDNDLVQQIEYHLLEPLTTTYPLVWAGSGQFAMADILGAITRRQNETLGDTNCTISIGQVNAPILPGRVFLPDTNINIRRVSWQPEAENGFSNVALRQSDPWAKRSFDFGYRQKASAPPGTWMQSAEPPPSFDVDRTPPVPGIYEVLTVNSGPDANAAANATLTIPDDWTWVVKYGAMIDLFDREANAKDSLRMTYCQQRYKQGLAVMKNAPAALALYLDGVPMFLDSVRNGDDFNARWQSASAGTPTSAYTAGLNLIGFGPQPDSGQYGALLQCVINAPVPANNGDFIQIGRNDYDSLLDYCQHIAALKQGGAEFIATMPLFSRFIAQASLYNSKLREMAEFQQPMYEVSQLESERTPTFSKGQGPGDA